WCVATPFIFHYSFILPLLVLGIFLFVGNKLWMYYAFFLFSLLISEINISQFNQYVEQYAPQSFVERSESYRSESKVEEYRSGDAQASRSWHAQYAGKALRWSLIAFLILIYWKARDIIYEDQNLLRVLSFTLLFFG